MPPRRHLNVPEMAKPFLDNYNAHVVRFIRFLQRLNCQLVYEGPRHLQDHITERTVYACSVKCLRNKTLSNVFPVMIGSKLDIAIRKKGVVSFFDGDLGDDSYPLSSLLPFEDADIGLGFFVINGCLRQVPYFFTNDPTNTHLVQKTIVRCFVYDSNDRGRQLSCYMDQVDGRNRGDLCVVHNDGSVELVNPSFVKSPTNEEEKYASTTTTTPAADVHRSAGSSSSKRETVINGLGNHFFNHCPYSLNQEAYMSQVFKEDRLDIDHFSNKTVVSPGHLFVKLFVKYLFGPLQQGNWPLVKSKTNLVVKSIETGCLLHVLSRKTLYFKENCGGGGSGGGGRSSAVGGSTEGGGGSLGKMVTATPKESHREIGANGEIYMEKSTGCYKEVNSQSYPLNPYLLPLTIRQISSKVKSNAVCAFHPSYVGYLCVLGCFETKNVGRTHMMVRDCRVSSFVDIDPVFDTRPERSRIYELLRLKVASSQMKNVRYVVVNEACIPVTIRCFERLDLLRLKRKIGMIECLQRGDFVYVRYKIGFVYKLLPRTSDFWVTVRDEMFWAERLLGIRTKRELVDLAGYDYICSYLTDLNPFFRHNSFPKNMLAFNALKNAILATDKRFARYFMDTVSAYTTKTSMHEPVVPLADDEDGISKHFVMYVPKITVAYHSFQGCNQEDCIVVREGLGCFDCCRFYTVRLKIEASAGMHTVFYPVQGDSDENDTFLGTLAGHSRVST